MTSLGVFLRLLLLQRFTGDSHVVSAFSGTVSWTLIYKKALDVSELKVLAPDLRSEYGA